VKRKAPLDQGRKKSKPKKKEKKEASSSSSQLINTQELFSDVDSESFVESFGHMGNQKQSHCTNCQCLLTAFEDESIASAAKLLVDIRNLYFLKTVDEVQKLQYQLWAATAELGESVDGRSDNVTTFVISHSYNIPESKGGGLLCRENWLWLYDISLYRCKQFSRQLNASLKDENPVAKFDFFKEPVREFSDKTYVDLPYDKVKTLFQETLGING
jgi:hypothetical protein